MRATKWIAVVALAVILAGCETTKQKDAPRPVAVALPQTKGDVWQRIAKIDDANRIRRLVGAWTQGLTEARAAARGEIAAEAELLKPNAALPRPAPTPGSYSCRMVTLGKEGGKGPAFQKFKPFFCYVEVDEDLLTIVKQTGSQRPAGRLWEDDASNRLIFLGTLALGNEEEARPYGQDPRRDMAGVFERIAPFKWRLVIPYPKSGAKLDVIELTPVAEQPQ